MTIFLTWPRAKLPPLAADGSGNGTVDTIDYNFWRARPGHTADSAASATAKIPGPARAWVLVLWLIAAAWRVLRFRREYQSTF
jgi:hypothetical protein